MSQKFIITAEDDDDSFSFEVDDDTFEKMKITAERRCISVRQLVLEVINLIIKNEK